MKKHMVMALIISILLLSVFSNKETFKIEKDDEVVINPFMGFAPPAEGGPYVQPHSLVYANFSWKDLEPEKGFYDFEKIEEKYQFDYWKKNNKRLIFRIVLDYPGKVGHKDIPEWLYNEIDQDGTWYEHEWGSGFSPNYDNPKLIDYHKKLIEALAKRYNEDPYISFVELGSLGHWGEWHTLQQDGIQIPFPKLPVVEIYVKHYIENFTNKILLMRRPHQIAMDNKMGFYNDMFGRLDHTVQEFHSWVKNGYKFWLTGENHPPMPDAWRTAPIGGEFAPTRNWGDYFSSTAISSVMEQLELTHVSWLGPSSPANYSPSGEHQNAINRFLSKMGYHFRLTEARYQKAAKAGSKFSLEMKWENSGVAPFYFDWPLEISLANQDGKIVHKEKGAADIREWLPGEHSIKEVISIPRNLKKGVYEVNVAILDPDKEEPAIYLEMKGKRDDLRYKVGEINVK
ncbi:DUF4832 domain-containing protein [Lederbergia citri]|uniref:DUF4832 domain-containing protein n=1 Tax=Lederbergia citri TaxID=2833580 RepID=A0A942TH04_9BACI|nr:DUF4832 domain-containing protein [Lederbergia citri]MBS4196422.1 DUF4832 domain-containing protein [Lederbergia citri]